MVNIPPNVTSIREGSAHLIDGALQTRTDFGKPGYGGACPPESDHPHRYIFTIYSVSVDALPTTMLPLKVATPDIVSVPFTVNPSVLVACRFVVALDSSTILAVLELLRCRSSLTFSVLMLLYSFVFVCAYPYVDCRYLF